MADLTDDEVQAFYDRANGLSGTDDARGLYRDWAPVYDATITRFGPYLAPDMIADAMAARLADRDAPILDVACGTGLLGAALARRGYRALWGMDLSPEMLDRARQKGCYAGLVEADVMAFQASALPAPPAALVCAGALTWAHLPASALERMLGWLPPGGLVVADVERFAYEDADFPALVGAWQARGLLVEASLTPERFYDFAVEEDDLPHGYLLIGRRGPG